MPLGEKSGLPEPTRRRSRRSPALPLSDAPLIEREPELDRLQSALDAAASGFGRMVVIAGEPGVGKTRLAHELLAHASARDLRCLIGRCFEQFSTVPFMSVAEALADGFVAASPRLQADAKDRWPDLAHVVPSLGTTPTDLPADGGELRVFRAATAFLKALALEQPLVLLLEDLHWADSASLGLLLNLSRNLHDAPMLVVCTYRDADVGSEHPFDATLRELVRERRVDELALHELTPPGSAALIRAHLGVSDVANELVQFVHARTEGNPFFIEEVLKSLVEQGALQRDAGRWAWVPAGEIDVPRSVRSLVGQRVGRLKPRAQELLRIASVLGQEFALDALQRIADQPETDLLDDLDAVFRARLIVAPRVQTLERYAFAHALIQHSLYAELPPHRVRRLHQRVGEVLEMLRASAPEASAELAYHFVKAGDAERALKYSVDAGDRAASKFAHVEAVQHYTTAVQLATDAGPEARAAHLREKLASELSDTSRVEHALAVLDEALDTYRRLGDRLGEARVHHLRSRVFQYHFDYRSAEAPIDEALKMWPADQQATAEYAVVVLDAARLKVFSGNHVAARPLAERGLVLCERLGDASLLARALIEVEGVRSSQGHPPRELIPLLDRAEELARAVRHWRWVARASMNRGGLKEAGGDLLGSREDIERAVAMWDRGGFVWGVGWGGFALARVCLALGDWHAARLALRKARDNQPHFPGLDVLSAWLDGDHRQALRLLPVFIEDTRRRNDAQNVQGALLLQADFALQLGDLSTAEAAAREALELPVVELHYLQNARVTLAEAAVYLSAPDTEAVLEAATERIDEPAMRCEQPQLLRALGLQYRAAGDLANALDRLLASADAARAQHALVQLGRTLAVLSDVARARRDSGAASAADAERARIVARIGPAVRGLNWATRMAAARAETRAEHAHPLTPRESEVAALIARGLTNGQIARALVITDRTVAAHIEHINSKLGFTSRTQIGVWAAHRQYHQLTPEIGGSSDAPPIEHH